MIPRPTVHSCGEGQARFKTLGYPDKRIPRIAEFLAS